MMSRLRALTAMAALLTGPALAADGPFTLRQALDYPFESELTAASAAPAVAWVRDLRGVRNVWLARGPDLTPRQVTAGAADDGQEISNLVLSPDARVLAWVRGGDHDANWAAEGGLAPDPDASPAKPEVAVWVSLDGGAPIRLAEGDAPAVSATQRIAFLREGAVWTAAPDGKAAPERLFFDRGRDSALAWSPDGSALAFVSQRGDHAFIGVYRGAAAPLLYLAPSTGLDSAPVWSPDGRHIAFVRQPGQGGPPEPILSEPPRPWAIWTADASTGEGRAVWRSPAGPAGDLPEVEGGANLAWAAGDRLVFMSEADGWPHLYAVPAAGGAALRLTSGDFMVEHVALSPDRRLVIYDANTGAAPDDLDRRHLFVTPADAAAPRALTGGDTLDWMPAPTAGDQLAFIQAGARTPPAVAMIGLDGGRGRVLDDGGAPADFPAAAFVVPKAVSFTAADGVLVHGQLFARADGPAPRPGLVFVHGGPPRQMLLGWHYMDYYSNAYAMNQYFAAHGFTVLAVNYRLGIGYGRAFQHPPHAGFRGAAEYQDIQAAAGWLRHAPGTDPGRIGIWGGSYGGYLTALALARNSDVFKAGVDLHGVHDWWRDLAHDLGPATETPEANDRAAAMSVAWAASPDSAIAGWRSPVLLIQGDDDRNVDFHQTVDLARRLTAQGVPFDELVLPDEIHGFLRYASWLKADGATARFLEQALAAGP